MDQRIHKAERRCFIDIQVFGNLGKSPGAAILGEKPQDAHAPLQGSGIVLFSRLICVFSHDQIVTIIVTLLLYF